MEKVKTYKCIEYNEVFYIEAKNLNEAKEFASMYGGGVIELLNK